MATSKKELKRDLSAVKAKMAEIDEAINAADTDTDTAELTKEFDKQQKRKNALVAAIARKEALEDEFEDDMEKEADDMEDDEDEECAPRGDRKGKKGKKSADAGNSNFSIFREGRPLDERKMAGVLFYAKAALQLRGFTQKQVYDNIRTVWKASDSVAKTAVGAMTTAVPTITQDASPYVIELLNAESVFRKAGAHIEPMPRGQKTIYRQNLGATGYFFGEGQSPTVSKVGYDHIDLTWHKMGALVYVTREELMFPSVNTGDFIISEIALRLGLLEDITFFNGSSSITGLFNRLVSTNTINSTTISSAVNWQSQSNDLATVESLMTGNNVRGPFAIFCHPNLVTALKAQTNGFTYPFREELSKPEPTLNGHRVYTTTQLGITNSVTDLVMLKPEHMIIGDAYNYDLQISDQGSFNDGGTQVNLFGEQKVAFLGTAAIDFAVMHNVSAAVLQTSGWVNTSNVAASSYYAGDTSNTTSSASSVQSNN